MQKCRAEHRPNPNFPILSFISSPKPNLESLELTKLLTFVVQPNTTSALRYGGAILPLFTEVQVLTKSHTDLAIHTALKIEK